MTIVPHSSHGTHTFNSIVLFRFYSKIENPKFKNESPNSIQQKASPSNLDVTLPKFGFKGLVPGITKVILRITKSSL